MRTYLSGGCVSDLSDNEVDLSTDDRTCLFPPFLDGNYPMQCSNSRSIRCPHDLPLL
eukprot:CAMPEP_0202969978 /NCGR_PEP_ID=MMETSP1396-20130829/15902_1 /ASSEMBLY_ACC=CAM_ASM_000872 /TAXON_ID= /ORGANISM="Pseudokeronopsis sp., Strain Brazil" /LENGTH=56 /DNA_ID=CAMNT_0049698115 /DNA_START=49 /DNA_END=219 /DNA_ORIENTATION=+